jgi:hypothetical protein
VKKIASQVSSKRERAVPPWTARVWRRCGARGFVFSVIAPDLDAAVRAPS